jgi:hypothetical protein
VEKVAVDSGKLWGLHKLFDEQGKFRWKKQLIDQGLHFLMALGFGGLAAFPLAQFAGWGAGRCALVGMGAGLFAVALREAIQWLDSKAPHLVDRALDVSLSPAGGAGGGIVGYWLAGLV